MNAEKNAARDLQAIATLNAEYVKCIDDDELEQWPQFFQEACLYKVTTAGNYRAGLAAGMIYADSRGMLLDRIASLRRANVFEHHGYRHILGAPALRKPDGEDIGAETPFLVVRIMRTGQMEIFATGRYVDRIVREADGMLKFRERIVVCDGCNVDTLLVIPL